MTPFDSLKATLNGIVPLQDDEWVQFQAAFTLKTVATKTVLVQEGQIATELYYLQSGLIRLLYTRPDGEQITSFIFSEGMFAGCLESFLQQAASIQTLVTMEPCQMLAIKKKALETLYQEVPKTHSLMRCVLEQRFIYAQNLFASYLLDGPQERYEKFAQQHPDLLQRIPQYVLASFLGITPVSLSRIRKRISRQP